MTETILRILVLLAIFAAVFLLVGAVGRGAAGRRSHLTAINKRLRMIRSGVDRQRVVGQLLKNQPRRYDHLPRPLALFMAGFQRKAFASGVPYSSGQMISAMAGATLAIFIVILILFASADVTIGLGSIMLAGLFALAVGGVLPYLVISRLAERRRKKIEQQFPVALDVFVRALRSGHPIASAIELLTNEMDDPIGSEFGLVSDEVAYGADLPAALQSMAERWNLDDMRMFVVSLSVQSETGGNLAEILENLSKVIRERAQMFMKVRALSSEGRMTGVMLTALPVLAFILVFVSTPQFYLDVAGDPIFIFGASGLLVLYVIGVFVIRRMVDLKV